MPGWLHIGAMARADLRLAKTGATNMGKGGQGWPQQLLLQWAGQNGVRARTRLRSIAPGLAVHASLHPGLDWRDNLGLRRQAVRQFASGSRCCAMDGAIYGAGDGNHPSGCRSVLLWMAGNSRAAWYGAAHGS